MVDHQPSPFGRWFSAGVASDGSYGVPRGLIFSSPPRIGPVRSDLVDRVQNLYLDGSAQKRLTANVAELEHETWVMRDVIKAGPAVGPVGERLRS